MYFSSVAIFLGATVVVWTITSQGLRFYSNCCNADPCRALLKQTDVHVDMTVFWDPVCLKDFPSLLIIFPSVSWRSYWSSEDAVNVAIQIRARVLLKQQKYVFLLCHDSLGGGRIGLNNCLAYASQDLRFYSNCCDVDPCMGIAETNWLCCH